MKIDPCTDPDCPIAFVHSDCEAVKSRHDNRLLGYVFRDSDGNWTYVGHEPSRTGPLPSGITESRATAKNWLRLGDRP